MDAVIRVDEGARLAYREAHYHGLQGGAIVQPRLVVTVKEGGRYFADFSLVSGLVGSLTIDSLVEVGDDAVAELTAKVFGRHTDAIYLKDSIQLLGERAVGFIKTRVVVTEHATAEVTGIAEAYGKGARGHIDCKEIVKDEARASASPVVKVCHSQAKVTHEAAIGSVDRKELETLMARGLTPDEAIEMIVVGILR